MDFDPDLTLENAWKTIKNPDLIWNVLSTMQLTMSIRRLPKFFSWLEILRFQDQIGFLTTEPHNHINESLKWIYRSVQCTCCINCVVMSLLDPHLSHTLYAPTLSRNGASLYNTFIMIIIKVNWYHFFFSLCYPDEVHIQNVPLDAITFCASDNRYPRIFTFVARAESGYMCHIFYCRHCNDVDRLTKDFDDAFRNNFAEWQKGGTVTSQSLTVPGVSDPAVAQAVENAIQNRPSRYRANVKGKCFWVLGYVDIPKRISSNGVRKIFHPI